MFEPVVPGVVESTKNSLMPTNPNLTRELNEVSAQLRKEYEAKKAELVYEVAIVYAKHFTEQELKDLVTFYKTPLGQKVLAQEPRTVQASMTYMNQWAQSFSETVANEFRSEMKKRGKPIS